MGKQSNDFEKPLVPEYPPIMGWTEGGGMELSYN